MDTLSEKLSSDKELQELRYQYKAMLDMPAPGFNFDEYDNIDDYKEYLRKKIKEAKTKAAR